MTFTKIAAIVVAASALLAGEVSAKGCLAGAAIGGAAGHFAGHHSIIGAGVGCAIGRHRANKKDREIAASNANQKMATPVQQRSTAVRTTTSK
jgi:hypothetical protein